jgi:hypothetical protein
MLKFYLHPPHSVWTLLEWVMWTVYICCHDSCNCHEWGNERIWNYRVDSDLIRIGSHKYIIIFFTGMNVSTVPANSSFKQLRVPDQWQLQNSQLPGLRANVDRPLPVWSDLKSPILLCFALFTAHASTWPESRVLVHTAES